ncbi:unnamed protein product [Brassicogethes aeneus]|uniref:Scavenger receptor class B member 1 n=1 Tax=Brassicogethes aeneus TaxID=1431903 RepID=A0A9P0AY77_BRAAE|nr:unnamed protein product [Brassicogethes aeneus]
MELQYNSANTRVLWLAILGIIMVCSSYLTFAYNPLQIILRTFLTLKQGSIFFNLWSNPPYDVLIKVYIFNITNSNEFLAGTDPKLNFTEVGPYYYKEILTNENATFNEDGTILFHPKRRIEFDSVRSLGNPMTDRIISPNIPMIGIQSFLNQESFLKNLAFSSFSTSVGAQSFLNLTVNEYLWGYEDKLVVLANKFMPSWIDFDTFGILDRLLNKDNNNVLKISNNPDLTTANAFLTPQENKMQYHIVEVNGSPGLKEWGWQDPIRNETIESNKRCQLVAGTFEGTIMPSFMEENTTFQIFRKAFCRPVPMEYIGKGEDRNGFEAYNYRISDMFLETPEVYPENECYCVKGRCLPKGLGHLSPCYYGIPITMSHPHFFNGDPSLVKQVNGMNPDREIHDSLAQVHPTFGVPLDGHLKVQINLDVGQTRMNYRTTPLNGLHLPLFWLELTVGDFPDLVYYSILFSCHILPVAQTIIMYLLGFIGLALISTSALLVLFFNAPSKFNDRLSLKKDYSAIPTITIHQQYFKPEIKISKC